MNSTKQHINISTIRSVYFIGIGGIGMSAIARYFLLKGVQVFGYDKTETTFTKQLVKEGINIQYQDDINIIPKEIDVVIYTPAIPADNNILQYYKTNNYTLVKRSDVLQAITDNTFNICIAGTHGKTTVSTMVAHILRDTEYGCTAFLGGISSNYQTNFWSTTQTHCVVEADEYDRSFLKLNPDIAVITAMDPDHLDIYGTALAMEQGFIDFTDNIKPNGLLISKYGLPRTKDFKTSNHITYSLQNNAADVYAENIIIQNGSYQYDVVVNLKKLGKPKIILQNIVLHMGGMHNVENTIAAIAVALYLGIDEEKIKQAIENFKGVKRRFEYILKPYTINQPEVVGSSILPPLGGGGAGSILIDDYAHHPAELKALIQGAKTLYPNKQCTIVFQPHLFTRTRDLANEFAESLSLADEVILLPIYPARELPIEGITSNIILEKIQHDHKKILSKEALLEWVKQHKPELLLMAGAGDIDILVELVKNAISN